MSQVMISYILYNIYCMLQSWGGKFILAVCPSFDSDAYYQICKVATINGVRLYNCE